MAITVKKKVSKVNIEFPIGYFEGNLIFNHDKSVWAIYEIDTFVYDHLSDQQKIDKLIAHTSFLTLLTDRFHILWLPRTHDITEHHSRLKERLQGPLRNWGKKFINTLDIYLNERYNAVSGTNNADYRAFIAVYLPKNEAKDLVDQLGTIASEVKKLLLHPKRTIEHFAGLNEPEVFEHEWQAYTIKERQIFDRLSRKLKVERVDHEKIEWLIKRNFWWGIAEPTLRSSDIDGWSPKKTKGLRGGLKTFLYDPRQVLTLTEGDIDTSRARRVTITQPYDGEDKKIHHAYLALSDLPDNMDHPGSEWLYSAATLPFPVQMSIKVDVLESRDAIKKLSRKKMDIDNQVKNINEANAQVPLDLQEKQEKALYLEDEYKKRKNPTFVTHVSFGLYHADLNMLKSNVKIFQDHFRDMGNIQIELPAGDQWLLFNDFIPGSPRYVSDYIQRIPPETLAAGMIGATQSLGDGKGLYIGTTGSNQNPVYVDLRHASQINRSPSFSITGTLGGGKSVLLNLLGYQNTINGGKTLMFDPKGERSHWPDMLPELKGHIQVATLSSAPEDVGKLDPFVMLKNIEDAKEAAMDILAYLSSVKTDTIGYSYISQSVMRVASEPKPYLTKCIDVLRTMGETRHEAAVIAEVLHSFADLSFAKLLFGKGDHKSINMDFAMNILQVQNLKMPPVEKSPANYSLIEKMSIATMYSIGSFMDSFIYFDRGVFTLANMDEAWAILATQIGKEMANRVIRTGRSLNGGLGIATQNATDMAGDLAGNIGMKFAFRDQDTEKIKNTLAYFGLERTQDNIDLIRSLENGQCLMQDIYGRVGVLSVDVVFQHLFDCFDTRPPERAEEEEVPVEEHEFSILERFALYQAEAAVGGEDPHDLDDADAEDSDD
ncbi:AAA-like domain-containing protein [Paenibacillus sp. UNC496MF]|uniref:ATP-binding protein n=1 Tax=Paenibacillus sp. UNC496MF TaxID=1502753 RepID=UPI0008E6F095|nr:ATP-binding protein [Paenibacillus sp. UNC496MF]SFJ77254.1 AAA-like domain-containing protein [Paenibacillus sp. UNC496MF]